MEMPQRWRVLQSCKLSGILDRPVNNKGNKDVVRHEIINQMEHRFFKKTLASYYHNQMLYL